jgi:LuxR family transcriptional regulator, maltose regulon positive regulatory protein
MGATMRIQQSSRQGCVVLALVGRLDLAAVPQVRRAILKQLAEQPPAIICDLSQVEAVDPLCAAVFASIQHPALDWPGTALMLCGARPAVADTLQRLGMASRLAMYPSLDQALANVGTRPPWLRETLALEPVAAAARLGREFVREVCGRWGLQSLADPAALLASELVTLAVGHSGSAMELRVELGGRRLQVAVHDQDPNLLGLLAPKDRIDQGMHLLILDQVATAWGVRQDAAGGKTAWCTLEVPAPPAARDAGGRRQPPAGTAGAAMADDIDATDRGPARAPGLPGPELVWSKLAAPAPRAGLIARVDALSLLQAGLEAKLCLLDAPAGSGKTTLLAQWQAAAGGGRVAWVSLDEGDNDPTRFWVYVVQALRTVEPGVGTAALRALRRPSVELDQAVLPSLLNELSAIGGPLVLVLDDYHLITNPTCHQSLGFFLDHLPAGVHVVLATRVDPPLQLARMRARGELVEFRVADLQFTGEEATALLNDAMGLGLSAEEVERLVQRTEGWAAGLVLAGLSLRGRPDADAFIAVFQGDNRHVADYLAAEVLARQPEQIREFLLQTSVLDRLSGPLCDAVLEAQGSAELLAELERSNLFLVPVDDHRQWYRYHQLFAQLLRLELSRRDPELVAVLHRRAVAWHRQAGNINEAIGHASAARDYTEAGALIARHWATHWLGGQRATVARWLDGLPDEAIMADPPVALITAWSRGFRGASKQDTERWLAAAEDPSYAGPPPDGLSSQVFGAALARATLIFDDVGRAAAAARRALELAGAQPGDSSWAGSALGQTLYLSGRSGEARSRLEDLVTQAPASVQPYAVVTALAVLSLIAADQDDPAAASLARRAVATASAHGISFEPLTGTVYLALGRALARQGELDEAETQLERALELFDVDAMALHRALALLALASVRHGRGDLPGAWALVDQARELIHWFTDPGMLPSLLEQAEGALGSRPRRRVQAAAPLTEREMAVLRLLPTRLSTREISRELYVSVNTVRSHVQAIYRKLGVATRPEAVAHARHVRLLPQPGPSPTSATTHPSGPSDSA